MTLEQAFLAAGVNGPEFGKASPWGLLIILLLLIGLVVIIRSMTKHLGIVKNKAQSHDFPQDKPDSTAHDTP